MADEAVVWGIHGGRHGEADKLFLKHNVVAIGSDKIGDLSKLPADRETIKQAVAIAHPEYKPGAVPVQAGQLYRFAHEMAPGDLVVYPSKIDKKVHIGCIEDGYRYDSTLEPEYPHRRPVKWLKTLPRTTFSQGALYEIGSALSLFQVKTHMDEFLGALKGDVAPTPVDKDETIVEVAQDIEQTTRDFILKTLSQELKGHPFAHFVAHLLNTMNYRTRVSPPGPDGGIDIVAHRDELGFEPPIIKVQVKSSNGNVGNPEVAALYGNVGPNEHGLLVTLGSFTQQAINFAKGKGNLRLISGDDLIDLVLANYELFDSRYKGILPLKRVYVPVSLTESAE